MGKKTNRNISKSSLQSEVVTVLPGDDVTSRIDENRKSTAETTGNTTRKPIKLGVGLMVSTATATNQEQQQQQQQDRVYCTMAGRLVCHRNTYFVLTSLQRYIPVENDRVVGIVEDRIGGPGGVDVYRVNIGGPHLALLSSLEFEGATKRNRPQLENGTMVYTRIAQTNDEVWLSCRLGPHDQTVGQLVRKDWMTDEATYGRLRGGTFQKISAGLARELLSPDCPVLEELGFLPFEVAIGVNGYLWIHSNQPEHTILVRNAILNSEILTHEQTRGMVRQLLQTMKQRQAMAPTDDDDDDDDDDVVDEEDSL